METVDEILENIKLTRSVIYKNLQANTELDSLEKEIRKRSYKTNIFSLIAFPVIFGSFFLLTILVLNFLERNNDKITKEFYSGLYVLGFIIFLLYVTATIVEKMTKMLRDKIIRERYEKNIKRIEAINSEIIKTYEEIKNSSIFPMKYNSIQALDKIEEYINDKRADSLKEVLNLYEDELMKLKQLEMLNNISLKQSNLLNAQYATNRQLAWQTFVISLK